MVRTKKYRIKSNIRKKTLKQKKIKTRNRKSINKKKKRKMKSQKGGATGTINNLQELFNKISVSSNKKWNPHNKRNCHDALIELANLDTTNNLTLEKVLELRKKLFVCLPEEANKQMFTRFATSVTKEPSNNDKDN